MENVAEITAPTNTVEPEAANGAASAATGSDPFELDQSAFAALTPEQKASLTPVMDGWKKKAQEEISRRESQVTQKYKPYEEKAQALEKLTTYQPFVQWWQEQQKTAAQVVAPGNQAAISQTKPSDFATPTEWQEALYEAAQGDGTKLQSIQSRMMAAWATPFVQQITQKQQHLETQIEMKEMFERHPDAKELNLIGIDPKTKEGVSLLEQGIEWAERSGKPREEGYLLARRWADSMKVGAQQEAMGLVNGKKKEVTASNSTANNNGTIIEVENADELLKRSLQAQMEGNKDVRFVIKSGR